MHAYIHTYIHTYIILHIGPDGIRPYRALPCPVCTAAAGLLKLERAVAVFVKRSRRRRPLPRWVRGKWHMAYIWPNPSI